MTIFSDEASRQDEPQAPTAATPSTISLDAAAPTHAGGPILAVDVGSVHTRAVLLDVVEGTYTFVAHGEAPTTTGEPWNDILEGVFQAIGQIAEVTGRTLLDQNAEVIIPEQADFYGVNAFVATASAGQPIRAILIGLMPDISLQSAQRAAESIYLSIVDTLSLDDPRTSDEQIDAIMNANADLVIVVGGTNGGAVETVSRFLETVTLAYSLMDNRSRPPLLYAGNSDLAGPIVEVGHEIGIDVITAPNVRPTLETEYLEGAQAKMATMYNRQKSQNTQGFGSVGTWTREGVYPTAHGFGRFIHLMGNLRKENVLGIDLGSSSTTIAASIDGERYLNVFNDLGVGHAARGIFEYTSPASIARWLTFEPENDDHILDHVWNLSLYPRTIPERRSDVELLYALAREIIRAAIRSARGSWRSIPERGLLPPFDTILLSGATLTRPPHYSWSVLTVLDALLPVGLTNLLVDPYGVATALGAVAPEKPLALVQALGTDAFFNLGMVVSTTGRARSGDVVLQGQITPMGGEARSFAGRFGEIRTVPLDYGAKAKLVLRSRRVEVDDTNSRQQREIRGGNLGLIVDTRGRPWRLPRNQDDRRQQMHDWQQALSEEAD
jgi:hypothetical protein